MALIMTRKIGERIMIGDDIVVTVEDIRGRGLVVLGVQAPRAVSVDREEVRLRRLQDTQGEKR